MTIQFHGTQVELKYIDDSSVREVYADQTRFVTFDGTAVRIEFAIVRPKMTVPNQIEQFFVTSSRLVLSLQGAVTLHTQLSELMGQLEKAGALPKQNAPTSGKKQ